MPKKYRVEFSGTVYIVAESLCEAEEILIANPELTAFLRGRAASSTVTILISQ